MANENDGWRTITWDDELQTAEYWDSLMIHCLCDPTCQDTDRIVRIDPESDEPATCSHCGRTYRLAVQVREN